MQKQYTRHLLMIRPAAFQFNAETALSNAFQQELKGLSEDEIKRRAIEEFDGYVATLRTNGIDVIVFQDKPEPPKPDALFPNNWISMHRSGTVYLYPMCTPNRRIERNPEAIDLLKTKFEVKEIIDLSRFELENKFLEGTGSIIFDHPNKIAYACLSPRTDKQLFENFCRQTGYEACTFIASDENDNLVYHTNVMLTMGDTFAVVCGDSIKNEYERIDLFAKLEQTGHEIIDISFDQMNHFAGNMLQVENDKSETFLVMSHSAYDSLSKEQIISLEKHTHLLSVSIPTIETIGGGSARCMLAEIFLPVKGSLQNE